MKFKGLIAVTLMLCLLLAGCHTGTSTTAADTAGTTLPEITEPTNTRPVLTNGVEHEVLGSCTVTYSVDISQVKYITSADGLPNYEELAEYDDAWFTDHAMLVIMQTVGSGNTVVKLESIEQEDGVASITLEYASGGALGNANTTTWMLWVAVERDLDYTWQIANPAVESDAPSY